MAQEVLVSILVLMELPYQQYFKQLTAERVRSFNPCFNGIAISTRRRD